jgi:hypothetical protein
MTGQSHDRDRTHASDLTSMPTVGKPISAEAIEIGRIEDGQAQERWGDLDMYPLLTQLDIIPSPQAE